MGVKKTSIGETDMGRFGSGVILAGGKSARMGFDKQRVLIGGVLMVHYIARQLEAVFEEIIIVSNTPELYSKSKYRVVTDIFKDKGPLSGIHTGLRYCKSDYVYFVAGDMPVINTAYIRYMMSRVENQEVLACVTEVNGYIEPFNAFYSKASTKIIEASICKDHLKISRLVKEQKHLLIEEEEARNYAPDLAMFLNLNTIQKMDCCSVLTEPISVLLAMT